MLFSASWFAAALFIGCAGGTVPEGAQGNPGDGIVAPDASPIQDALADAPNEGRADVPLDTSVDSEDRGRRLLGPRLPCVPTVGSRSETMLPSAHLLPAAGALLSPMETIEIRFSEYMHADSISLVGDLPAGSIWWEPPYEVLLLEAPPGGWTEGGTLVLEAADRACNAIPPLEIAYAEVAEKRPVIDIDLRFFVAANDDGTMAAPLTEEIAALWLEEVNRVYSAVDMHFDMAEDAEAWVFVNDTAINGMHALSDPAVLQAAQELVAPYPDTLNVIFSWGPLPVPAQGGFTSPSLPFVSVTSFEETLLCGDLSRDVLPHEMGHYLGLPHTHQAEFWTVEEAQAAYDGSFLPWDDGFWDTPAVPHIAGQLCSPADSITLGGIPRATRPNNLMNYDWTPFGHLTWSQGGVARQTAAIRFGLDLRDLVSPRADFFFEAESLSPSSPDGWGTQPGMGAFFGVWSGDTQRIWGPQPGSQSALRTPVPEAGTYRLFAGLTLGPDFGIHRLGMNGHPGVEVNLYSPMVRHSGILDLGSYPLEAGDNDLEVTCLGPEANSQGTLLGLDYVLLRRE